MSQHIRLESVGYNPLAVEEDGARTIDPLVAKQIGEGGYARAYRVPAQPGLPVGGILKVFKSYPEPCRAGERLRRKAGWSALYNEYNLLCALDGLSGHVPQAYACAFFVVDDGAGGLTYSPAFLMEEIGGSAESLDEVVRDHTGPFDASQVAEFGLRVLDALDLLSEQGVGIAHSDLSPANVFVRRSPDGRVFEWAYLIDFGQAKNAARGVTPSFVRGVHPRMGTIGYCAPELIPQLALREGDSDACREHNELYGARSDATVDLWSLGALMYLLALRKEPRYSVEYAVRNGVSGFWRGEALLDDPEAFRILIEEKRGGLRLPDDMNEESEVLLGRAIACCTAWDPRERDSRYIRRLLSRVAEGVGSDARFLRMTHVPADTPALEGEDGPARGAGAGAGTVYAGVYKLTAPDGTPFSGAEADLLVFGDDKRAVDIGEYRYRGVTYAAEHVGPCYDMSRAGWGVKDWQCDSPWQSVRIVDFLTGVRPATTRAWFAGCARLADLLHVDRLDTSAVTDMQFMFHGCSSLEYVDVSGFDTSRVERMKAMFHGCSALRWLNVDGFDTSKVITMASMFSGCSSLAALDVSGFRTGSVADFQAMFDGCSALSSLDVSGFDTSSATRLNHMFNGCSSLAALDVSGFRTPRVESFRSMFNGCSSLCALDVSCFDTSCAVSFDCMFADCHALSSLDVSCFDTSSAADMGWMFSGCSSLAALDVSGFRTGSVADFQSMFDGCSALSSLDVSGFDTSSATRLNHMFNGCSSLAALDVSGFRTPRVESFGSMFSGCSSLSSLDVSGFDTSSAEYFDHMFDECSSLSSLDVSCFDTSCAVSFDCMFADCHALSSLDVSCFDASCVTNMRHMFFNDGRLKQLDVSGFRTPRVESFVCMFCGCSSLRSLDVSGFDTSSATDMADMFRGCSSLAALDVSGFDTSKVTRMTCMFCGCSSLRSLDVSGFDTSSATDMADMFRGCSSLAALDVSGFDTSKVTRMTCMFCGCSSLRSLDVSGFLTCSVIDFQSMVSGCSSLVDLRGWPLPVPESNVTRGFLDRTTARRARD